MTNKKDIVLFADGLPKRMKMKDLNSETKGGSIHLKSFPAK